MSCHLVAFNFFLGVATAKGRKRGIRMEHKRKKKRSEIEKDMNLFFLSFALFFFFLFLARRQFGFPEVCLRCKLQMARQKRKNEFRSSRPAYLRFGWYYCYTARACAQESASIQPSHLCLKAAAERAPQAREMRCAIAYDRPKQILI